MFVVYPASASYHTPMTPLWLDQKYILLVAHRLRNFKKKSSGTMNMSCPFCGDSKKNKRKARGYLISSKGTFKFHCHNCGITCRFDKFLHHVDPSLHDEYIRERFVAPTEKQPELLSATFTAPKFHSTEDFKSLQKVSKLPDGHPVLKWVEGRLIPKEQHHRLYFTKKFMHWTNELLPGKFDEKALALDEPRLVIPMLDPTHKLLGFQGRSFLKGSTLRYITIMLDDDNPKIFGLECVDTSKKVFVVEGPIDSLFLPNCVASAGADLTSNLSLISEDKSQFTLVFDREPRNIDIGNYVVSAINKGYSVALLPDSMPGKDINEYIKGGMTQEEVVAKINSHTYTGLTATMEFQQWKRW